MKLATVNPRMDFNMEALLSKELSFTLFFNNLYVWDSSEFAYN